MIFWLTREQNTESSTPVSSTYSFGSSLTGFAGFAADLDAGFAAALVAGFAAALVAGLTAAFEAVAVLVAGLFAAGLRDVVIPLFLPTLSFSQPAV